MTDKERIAELEAQVEEARKTLEDVVKDYDRLSIGKPWHWNMDHACADCPGATMVREGFFCARHQAKRLLTFLGRHSPVAALKDKVVEAAILYRDWHRNKATGLETLNEFAGRFDAALAALAAARKEAGL